MPSTKKGFITTGICAICFSTQAMASPQEQAAEPPASYQQSSEAEASVSEVAGGTHETRRLNTVTVTATRQEESVMDVPVTVDVVKRDEMDKHVVNSIEDLVRYQPGVQANRTTSGADPFGNPHGFTIRGVGGNRVQIQVDGSRVIEGIQNGNRNFVDLSMMKSVEIVRGPGSVLWGADALSGIVSYQTLDPDDLLKGRPMAARISAGYDSLDKGQTYTGMAASQFSPTFQGIIGYTYRNYSEAKLDNARADGGIWGCPRIGMGCNKLNPLDGNVNNLLAKFVWTPNVHHTIKLTGENYRSDADVTQLYDKFQTTAGLTNSGDYLRNQTQTRWRLGLEHEWIVDAGWLDSLKWRVSYSPQKRSVEDSRHQTRRAANIFTYQQTDYSEDFLQGDLQLTSNFKLGASDHLLTYGFQGDITKTDYFRKTTTHNQATNTWTTSYGGGTNFSSATTTRFDFFLQDEMKFMDEKLTVTPGIRWANYKINPKPDGNYNTIAGKEPRKLDANELIPQLSVAYKFNDRTMAYIRYAEGFKMPTAEQLYTSFSSATSNIVPNPDLKPEEVKSFEIGMRQSFEKGSFTLTAFHNDYTNFIKSLQRVSGSAKDYTSLNMSEVKIWGLEAATAWKFGDNWHVNASASYQHGKERDDSKSGYVPFSGASPLTGVVGVKWVNPAQTFDVELVGTFVKGINRTKDASYYKPAGYSVFDSYLNWQITKGVRTTFAVKNIFDKRYFISRASTLTMTPSVAEARTNPLELYTGAGRTFAVNLIIDF